MVELAAVRNYLNITYDDEAVNNDLAAILARADKIIRGYAGIGEEIELYADEEQLVLDCCRYIFNHAFEDFEANFLSQLTGIRTARQVEAYKAEQEAEGGS